MPDPNFDAQIADERPARSSDQRRKQRFACVDGTRLKLSVCPEFRCRRGTLVDVSAGGIGIILEEPLPVGTRVVFEVLSEAGSQAVSRIASVRHCRAQPAPEDAPWLPTVPPVTKFFRNLFGIKPPEPVAQAWFTGCQFETPLADADVERLLAMLQAPPEFFDA